MNVIASSKRCGAARGFTLIEILVVVAIMGIFLALSYPSVMNVLAERDLENQTREVQAFFQMTKLQAVNTKVNHRVRFFQPDGTSWAYEMERMEADLTTEPSTLSWVRVPGSLQKTISRSFNVTITLPFAGSDHVAEFSPVGTVANFGVDQNSVILQSPKLAGLDQMDECILSLFMGGSIQYAKRRSS